MPAAVVRQARGALEALEKREAQAQVDLFASAPAAGAASQEGTGGLGEAPASASAGDATTLAVLNLLSALQPDALSPREALQALYQLKDAADGHGPT